MKKKKIHWLFVIGGLLSLTLLNVAAFGQAKFYAAVSEGPLVAGQTFQVQYIVEDPKEPPQFRLPAFSSFTVHDSFDSKSTVIQSGAGLSQVYSKIVVLSVNKPGRYTIPGAKAFIDGKWQQFSSTKVEIVKDWLPAQPDYEPLNQDIPIEKNSELKPGESIEKKLADHLFMRAIASKTRCYVGEGVMVTYKFYSRINTTSQVLKRPSLTGFSVVEMVDAYESKPDIEIYNGQRYYVNLVRKVQLFPLQAGKFELEPAQISSTVHFMKIGKDAKNGNSDELSQLLQKSGADNSFSMTPYDHATTVQSQPLTLEAIPLPENGQPQNFSGGIGAFTLSLVTPSEPIHAGDLVKIRLIINGTGNIPMLIPPVVNWPKGVDTAEPEVKEVYNKYVFPLQGYKSFEYSFTAPDSGSVVIPAASFHYFNPATKAYQSANSNPVTLTILPAVQKAVPPASTETIVVDDSSIPRQLYWFAIVAVLIVSWIVFQIIRGKGKATSGDKVTTDTVVHVKEEDPSTEDILRKAQNALANNDSRTFYKELQASLWKVSGDYCGLPPSQQNKVRIQEVLRQKQTPDEIIGNLIAVQQECDWALYTTDNSDDSVKETLFEKSTVLVNYFRK